jgi:hypothetical protein
MTIYLHDTGSHTLIYICATEEYDRATSEGILLYWTASLLFHRETAVQLADPGWREENHKSASHYNWSLNI